LSFFFARCQANGLYETRKFDKIYGQIELILRGEILKQIVQIDNVLKEQIITLENNCEAICNELERKYQQEFRRFCHKIVIELIRIKNGQPTTNQDLLEADYESFIEIGVEYDGEYYPNSYIPIWKCKMEWFQKIGYLTRRTIPQLEKMISAIAGEMLEDIIENEK